MSAETAFPRMVIQMDGECDGEIMFHNLPAKWCTGDGRPRLMFDAARATEAECALWATYCVFVAERRGQAVVQ